MDPRKNHILKEDLSIYLLTLYLSMDGFLRGGLWALLHSRL